MLMMLLEMLIFGTLVISSGVCRGGRVSSAGGDAGLAGTSTALRYSTHAVYNLDSERPPNVH